MFAVSPEWWSYANALFPGRDARRWCWLLPWPFSLWGFRGSWRSQQSAEVIPCHTPAQRHQTRLLWLNNILIAAFGEADGYRWRADAALASWLQALPFPCSLWTWLYVHLRIRTGGKPWHRLYLTDRCLVRLMAGGCGKRRATTEKCLQGGDLCCFRGDLSLLFSWRSLSVFTTAIKTREAVARRTGPRPSNSLSLQIPFWRH